MPYAFEAAIFDMDGTLLDSMGYWRRLNIEFLQDHGYPLPADMREHPLDYSSHAAALRYLELYPIKMSEREIIADFEGRMDAHYRRDIPVKPGARRLLQNLRAAGVKMCLATATPSKTAEMALEKHDLLRYMDFVDCPWERGQSKREAQTFLEIAARLGVPPDRCAVFEDALYAARSAKAAGMQVYGVWDYTARNDRAEMLAVCDRYGDSPETLAEMIAAN